jgi:16S rRNA (adenine1518-N6/adenine1519-N6)-dimethyltransferase
VTDTDRLGPSKVGGRAAPSGGGPDVGARSRSARPPSRHRYGQNHLVDDNILRAIVDQAGVRPGDVVLEVGAADGRLTRPLLERASLVHAFEIDHRYALRLERLAAKHENLRVHVGDALKQDLAVLDPRPTALVANLAYNIAIPLIMTSIFGLPSIERWGVMVQKELGDRLFAVPSTKPYAAVSVLVQLACRREHVRPVPPSAFRPRPRVDSCFVTFFREPMLSHEEHQAIGGLVRLAFGQRRKVLTNTVAGAAHGGVTLSGDDVRGALQRLGLGRSVRPEELSPPQWVAFARELGWLGPAVQAVNDGASKLHAPQRSDA